jgi:hypothetical protein
VLLGVGWNIFEGKEGIDLDLSCSLFDTRGHYLEGKTTLMSQSLSLIFFLSLSLFIFSSLSLFVSVCVSVLDPLCLCS